MKKTILLFIISLLLVSCYSSSKVISKQYNYTKNINFSIIKIEESKIILDEPGNRSWHANSDDKFVLVHLTLINKSENTEELNFEDLLLYSYKTDTFYKTE